MAWKMEIMTMKTCFSNKLVHEPPKRWTWMDCNGDGVLLLLLIIIMIILINTDDNSKRESSQGKTHRVPSLLVVWVTLGQHAHP